MQTLISKQLDKNCTDFFEQAENADSPNQVNLDHVKQIQNIFQQEISKKTTTTSQCSHFFSLTIIKSFFRLIKKTHS